MFSIVMATRDRPLLLKRALESVAAQRFREFELILVDDSASVEGRAAHASLLRDILPSAKLFALPRIEGGHGPGHARNHGMAQASYPYVAFLDDDDEWIDPDYLAVAAAAITRLNLDMHFANQEAVRPDGSILAGPVWSEDLAQTLPAAGLTANGETFVVSPSQVLLSHGFAHLNTTIVRRALAWERLGGFDPAIAYEEDRDFFFRMLDAAAAIGYTPRLVARHYVPASRMSASSIPPEQKEQCRLTVLGKAIGSAKHSAIRARCRRDRSYTLKHMSTRAADAGQFGPALRHGRAALRDGFGVKWTLYLASLYARSVFAKRSHAG